MVYGKSCNLPVEMEYKAYWALKFLNFDETASKEQRRLQLLELEEMRLMLTNLQSCIKKRLKSIMTKGYSRRTSNQGNKCYCSTQDLNCSQESLNLNGLDHLPSRKSDHMEQWSFVILNLKILRGHG